MQKDRAKKLKKIAVEIANNFSRNDREHNYNNEKFEVFQIKPTSESTGLVYLKKNTGKFAIAFCYWINMNGGVWRYFIPTYDHCAGMEFIKEELRQVEQRNFDYNFDETDEKLEEIPDVLKPIPQHI